MSAPLHVPSQQPRVAELVMETINEGVTITDADFRYVSVNRAFLEMTGFNESELVGCSVDVLLSRRDKPETYETTCEAVNTTGRWRGERWLRRKDGTEFQCMLDVSKVEDKEEQHMSFVGVVTDLTDYNRAKRAISERDEEERRHKVALVERDEALLLALWGSDDIFWDYNVASGLRWRRGVAPHGVDLGERKASWTDHILSIHPDDLPQMRSALDKAAVTLHSRGVVEIFEYEFRIQLMRNVWTWLRIRGKVVEVDGDGKIAHITGWARDFTSTRVAEQQQRIATAVIDSMGESVAVLDLDFKITSINRSFTDVFGYTGNEAHEVDAFALASQRNGAEFEASVVAELKSTGRWRGRAWGIRKNGSEVVMNVEVSRVLDATGRHTHYVAVASDMTEKYAAEHEQRIATEVFSTMGEAVAVTDTDSVIVSVNAAFEKLFGYSQEDAVGKSVSMLWATWCSKDFYAGVNAQVTRGGHWEGEMWLRRRDGSEFLAHAGCNVVRGAAGEPAHYVAVLTDMTERKRAEEELRYLANYDPLTGLPNRSLFLERLSHAIVRARRSGRVVAVLALNIDHFNQVNEQAIRAGSEIALREVGARARTVLREIDTLARVGGDEIAVVLEELDSSKYAEGVAVKLSAAFAQPITVAGISDLTLAPSIGISLYPEHGRSSDDLLKFADAAMYQAKSDGRGSYRVYSHAADTSMRQRGAMIVALRRARERGELYMVYQPKWSLREQRIVGVEALMRWQSSIFGAVSPGVFIPLAEESGLILDLGEFALDASCAQLNRWQRHDKTVLSCAINISARQFMQDELPAKVDAILSKHDISPDRIEVELTESTMVTNTPQLLRGLAALRELGIRLAIDDFGNGYSSFSYLKNLSVDTLKIDQSFVNDLAIEGKSREITRSIISMAHSLSLNVVAEGVETASQLEILHEQDCDEIQGYFISKPLEAEACAGFVQSFVRG